MASTDCPAVQTSLTTSRLSQSVLIFTATPAGHVAVLVYQDNMPTSAVQCIISRKLHSYDVANSYKTYLQVGLFFVPHTENDNKIADN